MCSPSLMCPKRWGRTMPHDYAACQQAGTVRNVGSPLVMKPLSWPGDSGPPLVMALLGMRKARGLVWMPTCVHVQAGLGLPPRPGTGAGGMARPASAGPGAATGGGGRDQRPKSAAPLKSAMRHTPGYAQG